MAQDRVRPILALKKKNRTFLRGHVMATVPSGHWTNQQAATKTDPRKIAESGFPKATRSQSHEHI